MKRLLATLIALASLASLASALEIKDGKIKLVIDERSGRFAVYYLVDAAKNAYQPLLYDQETRTSYLTLYLDQRAYKLGEASEFKVSVTKEASGARIVYRSSSCVVTQSFAVFASGATGKDSVKISFSIENVSEKDISVGLRMLLDTWLGEKSGKHFVAQAAGSVQSELTLSGDYSDTWLRSPGESGASMQLTLAEPATKPDRVIAANWKRLNDSSWSMETSSARSFTLLPYSINDSAVAVYYDPQTLRRGASRTVNLVIGNESALGLAGEPAAAAGSVALVSAQLSNAPLDLAADLVAVRDILEKLNQAIAGTATPSPELLAQYEALIKLLESRKEGY